MQANISREETRERNAQSTRRLEKEREKDESKGFCAGFAKKRGRHEVDDDVGGASNVPVNIES